MWKKNQSSIDSLFKKLENVIISETFNSCTSHHFFKISLINKKCDTKYIFYLFYTLKYFTFFYEIFLFFFNGIPINVIILEKNKIYIILTLSADLSSGLHHFCTFNCIFTIPRDYNWDNKKYSITFKKHIQMVYTL